MKIKYVDNTVDLKLDKSDQVLTLTYESSKSNEYGNTPGNGGDYQHSYLNLFSFAGLATYGGMESINGDLEFYKNGARDAANTGIHEMIHGFLSRATSFYGVTEQMFGGDGGGHFNSSPNIMNSGDTKLFNRMILGKVDATQILPLTLQKVIYSWLKSDPYLNITPYKSFKGKEKPKSLYNFGK